MSHSRHDRHHRRRQALALAGLAALASLDGGWVACQPGGDRQGADVAATVARTSPGGAAPLPASGQDRRAQQPEAAPPPETNEGDVVAPARGPGVRPLPEFTAMRDIPTLKRTFYEFLSPLVVAENDRIRAQRRRLLRMYERRAGGARLPLAERAWLDSLARGYRLPLEPGPVPLSHLQRLLRRVDTVPLELALAQGAIESGWGRSRFAVAGNNVYGHWCYEPGCGLVPTDRPAGARHEVAVFESPAASVREYLRNLNTHPPYAGLRALRERQRAEDDTLDAHALAAHLRGYSTLREEYVRRLLAVMRQNRHLLPPAPAPRVSANRGGEAAPAGPAVTSP